MVSAPGTIRTPDQRLRVFVSSTLGELAAERAAVRSAVERMHLAPVMFELGARPHPPQDLYRAYLEQSDVFLGLYWESYGWVAPGDEISGLEDEYRLSGSLPKLIYLKKPADAMQPRLRELLDRVRSDGRAAYRSFSTPEELAELVETDLATLLAERFDQSRAKPTTQTAPIEVIPADNIPIPLTRLLGREADMTSIRSLLETDGVRLVTLTGPGGIGKSRLAIDTARAAADLYPGGVAFVSLAGVHDSSFVPTAIAQATGVRDTGVGTVLEKLTTALRHRTMLIVIDNFEQVLDAAPTLTTLLAAAPNLTLLVTSRTLLRLGGEHAYEVGALALPSSENAHSAQVALRSPAVSLFVERARAVRPDLEVTDDNADVLCKVVDALDGVPLAIELAAARARLLPPQAMLERLDRQLPLLVGGVRDLPERQQTIRNTLEWSVELLAEDDRTLLSLLGVFSGTFTLEAVEAVAVGQGIDDVLTSLGNLVDSSLVRQQDGGDRALFSVLSTVREYARERLDAAGGHADARARHAAHYLAVGEAASAALEGVRQRATVRMLAEERDNLRAAVRYLLNDERWAAAAAFSWALYIYWWIGGHLGEVRNWMSELLDSATELDDLTRARALYFRHAITFWQDPDGSVLRGLTESASLFRRAGDSDGEALARISVGLGLLAADPAEPVEADDTLETALGLSRSSGDTWGEAMALITIGRVALLSQHVPASLNRFEEGLRLSRSLGDQLGVTIALHHLGWAHLLLGDPAAAKTKFTESLIGSITLGHEEGIAYGIEGFVAIAALTGDVEKAGLLLGASEILREETGLYNSPSFSFHQLMLDPIRESDRAASLEDARRRGRLLSINAAIALAIPEQSS